MRKPYLLIALLLLGGWGIGNSTFAQSFTLNSNIPSTPLSVSLNSLPDTLAVAPTTLLPIATASGGTTPYSYSWGPSTANYTFPGDSSSPELLIDVGDPLLTYTVIVTDANGCTASDSFSVDPSTNASEAIERLVSLQVFPNPNNGSFHVSMQGKPFSDSFDMMVKDQLGRTVFVEHLPRFTGSFEQDVQLNDLSSGIYFLGFGSGEKVIYRKLIIE